MVTKKFTDKSSSEPLRLAFEVSLNKGKSKSVDCKMKNKLRPLWKGLRVGGKVRFQKKSSYKYTEATFCGLLNDAIVKDVLDQQ